MSESPPIDCVVPVLASERPTEGFPLHSPSESLDRYTQGAGERKDARRQPSRRDPAQKVRACAGRAIVRATMPELRKDPVVDRWVVIAPERADRPHAMLRLPPEPDETACPFCPGNEAMTPGELLVHRTPGGERNGPGWSMRIVPNRFPALRAELQLSREGDGLFDRMTGVGAHEVIIETDEHAVPLSRQPPHQVEHVLAAIQDRIHDLARDERLRFIQPFKNQGVSAGATLSHPHQQLVALPMIPALAREKLEASKAHYARKERCIYCDIVAQELKARVRMVFENERFVALSPWAARSPFELLLLPREHRSNFEHATGAELAGFVDAIQTVLRKVEVALENPAYNFMIHTLPLREPKAPWYHWHLELKPKLTTLAGFEWGTGFTINTTPPEEAAAFLRDTEV